METKTETVDTDDEVVTEPATQDVEVPAADPPEQLTPVERPVNGDRKSRKQARLDVEAAEKRYTETQQELARERQEGQRRDREIAEMRGQLQGRARQGENVSKQTEAMDQAAELRKQARSHLFFASQARDESAAEKAWKEHDKLNREAARIENNLDRDEWWEQKRGEVTRDIPNPQVAAALTGHETQFPWLLTNQEALSRADSELTRLQQAGHPLNRQTAIMALTWTAKAMGLGGHTPPTDAQRARYGGVPGGEGAGGAAGPRTIKMGRHEEALAKAAYPQLEAKDAFKQWAKEVGNRGGSDE